jgi:hypothetical protein
MSSTWIVAGLCVLIVSSLGLIVRWEYRLIQKRKAPKPLVDPEKAASAK